MSCWSQKVPDSVPLHIWGFGIIQGDSAYPDSQVSMPVSTLLKPWTDAMETCWKIGSTPGDSEATVEKTLVKAYFLIFLMLRNLRLSARRRLTVVVWFSIGPMGQPGVFLTSVYCWEFPGRNNSISDNRENIFFFLREYILKKSEIHFFPNLLHKPHISDEASLPKLGVGNFVKNLQSIHLFTWHSKSGGGVIGNKPETSMNNICLRKTK